MPGQKRHSKKIHDKKKSNPKRSIRQSKKGGILKTSMEQVKKLIGDMEALNEALKKDKALKKKENEVNEICDDSTSRALIKRIVSVVGFVDSSIRGMRIAGVESCSNLFSTNKNTDSYFECEERKIKQYEDIYDLCIKLRLKLLKCKTNFLIPIMGISRTYPETLTILAQNATLRMNEHRIKLNENTKYQEYKERKLKDDLKTYSKTTSGKDLYDTYNDKDTRATVSDVDYFYIKDNELIKLGKITGTGIDYNIAVYHENTTKDASTNYIIKFENNNNPILAYEKVNDSIINEKTFYSKPPEMKDAAENKTATDINANTKAAAQEAAEKAARAENAARAKEEAERRRKVNDARAKMNEANWEAARATEKEMLQDMMKEGKGEQREHGLWQGGKRKSKKARKARKSKKARKY